jgi:hypothetical protein
MSFEKRFRNNLDFAEGVCRFCLYFPGGYCMSAESKERWLNWLAFSTIIIALCATLSTFKGGGYSSRAMMNQSQASDQWAFYQSKSIKQYLFEVQKDTLELDIKKGVSADVSRSYKEKIEDYKQKIAKYDAEKEQIAKKAKDLESQRDEALAHSKALGFAVILLQLAVMISSITSLLKRRRLWMLGLCIGVMGVLWFINGLLLFF